MKRLWKTASGVLLAFLIFAPPGTMIFTSLFLFWLFGDSWWGILIVLIGIAAAVVFVTKYRKQIRKDNNKN